MKRIIYITLVLIGLLVLSVRFAGVVFEYFYGNSAQAGLKVLSSPDSVEVYIDGVSVGKTPFETADLTEKNYTIELKQDDLSWKGQILVKAGTKAVINRDLAKDPTSSAGETLTLEKGQGVRVISSTSGVEVEVDGKGAGKAPLSLDVSPGEHTFVLSHPGFLKRSIWANIPPGYNLTLSVDLAISEADLSSIVTEPTTATQYVLVKSTPTGFLRVRKEANIGSTEVARVKPKDKLVLLEELSGWIRVRLPDGKEGYVSSSYVEKVSS